VSDPHPPADSRTVPSSTYGPRYGLTHPWKAGAVGGALLLLAVVGAVAVGDHPEALRVDRAWLEGMEAMRRAPLTFVARHGFDPLGRFPLSWALVAVAGAVLWRDRRRWAVVVLLIGELMSWATNALIKAAVDRSRPPGALLQSSLSSFPSGHAAFAAVTGVLLVGLLVPTGRRAVPAVIAAALTIATAWSRIYLLVHWPSDVIGGIFVGAGVGLLTLACMGTAADRTDWQRRSPPSTLPDDDRAS
jgi:undecaprenyl-diphosphatase